jgi:hypothetical protein
MEVVTLEEAVAELRKTVKGIIDVLAEHRHTPDGLVYLSKMGDLREFFPNTPPEMVTISRKELERLHNEIDVLRIRAGAAEDEVELMKKQLAKTETIR